MNRTISYTRKFQLGNFQNMDVGTQLTDVPEELAFNQQFIEKVIYLQMVTGDLMYRKYFELDMRLEALGTDRIGKAIELLEKEKLETMAEIKSLLNPKGETK